MRLLTVATALLALSFATVPALADCASEIKMAETAVMKTTDADHKKMAMSQLDMAKKSMMDKMEGECVKQAKMATESAMKDTMKK